MNAPISAAHSDGEEGVNEHANGLAIAYKLLICSLSFKSLLQVSYV